MGNYEPPKLIGQAYYNSRLGKKSAAAVAGAFKFKPSGSANAAEKRNRTDEMGRSGFGATKPPTREGYINMARPGTPPKWVKKGPELNLNGPKRRLRIITPIAPLGRRRGGK